MSAHPNPTILLASPNPVTLTALDMPLAVSGAHVEVVLSVETALAALTVPHPPSVALLDANLRGLDPAMTLDRLLAAVQAESGLREFPIVLILDTLDQHWADRLAEGLIDDLLPCAMDPAFLRIRLDTVLRAHKMRQELELLRETTVLNEQLDRLTGIYNRETMLSILFSETDRVQRMQSALCMILFDIDDFGHWNSRLGADCCDELLCQVVTRTTRMLRSYDILGRAGKDEFLIILPGCGSMSAMMLAERLRQEVFSEPFHVKGNSAVRLSACFGIAQSLGRSPVVVLREAEQALQWAKTGGPESIQSFGESAQSVPAPVTFISKSSGDELLAW